MPYDPTEVAGGCPLPPEGSGVASVSESNVPEAEIVML